MKDLIKRSYKSIVARGMINPCTTKSKFIAKMEEELREVNMALHESEERYSDEVTDLATVCINQLVHLGRDPIKEFEKVVLKNEGRV